MSVRIFAARAPFGSLGPQRFPRPRRARVGLKRQLVHRAQQSLYLSGLAPLFAQRIRPEGALILYYHSIADKRLSRFIAPDNRLSKELFERQLRYLKKRCNIISLAHFMDWRNGLRKLPKRAALVTFDDGYLDNLTIAAPLLEKYRIPATLFLCTGYVERGEAQWLDELYNHFSRRTCHRLYINRLGEPFDLAHKREMERAWKLLAGELLVGLADQRRALLDEVRGQLRPQGKVPQLTLSWENIRRLKEHYPLFEVGLHTRDHLDLAAIDKESVRAEVQACVADYERELGTSARFFSYPYGRHNKIVRECVKAAGFECALATQPTALASRQHDVHALPRFETSRSQLDLQLWMTGAFPQLSQRVLGRVYD